MKKLLCLLVFIFIPLWSDEKSTITNSFNDFLTGSFNSRIEFVSYYRSSSLVEITGNEQTFSTGIRLDFDFIKTFKGLDFKLTVDLLLLEQLSLKGRLYDNFNPPTVLLNRANVVLPLANWTYLKLGITKPLLDVLPMRNYFTPIVFKTGPNTYTYNSNITDANANVINLTNKQTYANYSMVTGNRDDPLPYIIPLQNDTGISWNVDFNSFVFSFLFSNGEANLDSNSAKTFSVLIGYDDDRYRFGLIGQVGNIGSVPIKEFQNFIKTYFYYFHEFKNEFNLTVGIETLLHLHGLRDLDSFNRFLALEFLYTDGFFSPFMVFNDGSYDDSNQIYKNLLYGVSGLLFFEVDILFFQYTSHFSLYDPNLLTDNSPMYKIRFRLFNRIGFEVTPFLNLYFSHTYTHDEVFFSHGQFYDRESRINHPLIDQDFFGGIVFKF